MFYKISSNFLACLLAFSECVAQAPEGSLVVYSATYAATIEQSEYPVHTRYTITTKDDRLVERVANATGSFNSFPAKVVLPAGEYRVRAQYGSGRFVIVPVVIRDGQTTELHLDEEQLPESADLIRLPDGKAVGWRSTHPG
ncbi:MAG TPA: hypothetical protein VHB68_03005 [Steroidobacteraceae bacterium]|nr:hypothetical protein [Steroidobacteraceae bacterium]